LAEGGYVMRLVRKTALAIAVLLMLSIMNVQAFSPEDGLMGYIPGASNDKLQLYYHESMAKIAVLDKRSGMVWESTPSETVYPTEGLTEPLLNDLNSLLVLTYTEMNLNSTQVKTEPVMSLKPKIEVSKLNSGIRLTFHIKQLNLQIDMDAILDDDTLVISIPPDGLLEGIGSAEAVKEKLQPIKDFVSLISGMIDVMEKDSGLKGIRSDIARLKGEVESLEESTGSITDAVGIEAFSDSALESLNDIQTIYAGGSGIEGLFTKISKLKSIDEGKKKEYSAFLRDLDDEIMFAKVAASVLKTIKVGSVIELAVMPNFGAGADHEEGYAFYPDGSGAITYFSPNHNILTSYFKKDAYSSDEINIDWEKEMDKSGLKRTMLPVFGIHKDNSSYIAAVVGGDTDCAINYYPSGYVLNLSRVFASFRFRRVIETKSAKGVWTGGQAAMMYEKERFPVSPEIRYMFLTGEDSGYSGMAGRCREYLLENGMISQSPVLKNGIPLGLELLGGIKQKRVIFERYIKMTSFKDAENIIEYLKANDVDSVLMNLYGWTEEGYGKYPSGSRPAKKLGGEKGLRELSQFAKASGMHLFLQDNYIESHIDAKGYKNNELAQNNSQRVVRSVNGRIMLASPLAVLRRFIELILPLKSRYDIAGITFDSIGKFLYFDYSRNNTAQRNDTADAWRKLRDASRQTFGSAAVRGGNGYILKDVDWLLEIPAGATRYLYTDEEIPFYQMVVHGLVPYSSKPFNQFYDHRYEKLKAIEYGNMPYYILTWEDTSLLRNTDYNTLFSTSFEDWKDNVLSICKEFNDRLGSTADQYMISHRRYENGITEVRYGNGVRVLLNYSDAPASFEGIEIKAMDYVVIQ